MGQTRYSLVDFRNRVKFFIDKNWQKFIASLFLVFLFVFISIVILSSILLNRQNLDNRSKAATPTPTIFFEVQGQLPGRITCVPDQVTSGSTTNSTSTITASWKHLLGESVNPNMEICIGDSSKGDPGINISSSKYAAGTYTTHISPQVNTATTFNLSLWAIGPQGGDCQGQLISSCTVIANPVVLPSSIVLGIYQPQQDTSGRAIDRYISEAGKKPAFAWLPMTWKHPDNIIWHGSYWQFDPRMLNEFQIRGIMPGLNWDPSKGSTEAYPSIKDAVSQPEFSWHQIAIGTHDQYITQFAASAAAYPHPFILRILHEMNGTWYPWGSGVNGNTNPADYVAAWTHIVDIFRQEKATNVKFIWCPSVLNSDLIQKYGAILKQEYPGDNYVDWVCLDGYNTWKNGQPVSWRSLEDVFKPSYDFITSFSKRPMILWEVGSLENPTDPTAKANWITQGFLTTIPNLFPKVKVATWFNSKDGSDRPYYFDSSQNSSNAWEQVVNSPLYQGILFK